MALLLGCIADDVTGGTDLALALSSRGMKVVQVLGDVDGDAPDADAVIISLKIRSIPKRNAVAAAIKAGKTLQRWGAPQIYFKYCSTFDSTNEGNIGPIASALAELTQASIVPFVPSFPENGRTVSNGHLYVNGQLLSDSPMKDHPLTPMTESDLCIHLGAQVDDDRVGLIPLTIVEAGVTAVMQALRLSADVGKNYLIMDSVTDAHLAVVAKACVDLPLLTGGSAFAGALAAIFVNEKNSRSSSPRRPTKNGPVAILSGSCSAASNQQVECAAKTMTLLPLTVNSELEPLIAAAKQQMDNGAILISSTAAPFQVAAAQAQFEQSGETIERMFGDIARALYDFGIRTFIIGGGETSGAVAAALNLARLEVGPEITAGVPWMFDVGESGIQIAFKSGNFGEPDFFTQAIASLEPKWSENVLNQ